MTNTGIQTLNQAEQHLRDLNVVVTSSNGIECVDGITLLATCGYDFMVTIDGDRQKDNSKRVIDRQIDKHGFVEGIDYVSRKVKDGRVTKTEYRFTLDAANHVLLAAMTKEGKQARQTAINLATKVQSLDNTGLIESTAKDAYLGIAKRLAGLEGGKKTKWKEALKVEIDKHGAVKAVDDFINATSSRSCNALIKDERAELLQSAKSHVSQLQKEYGLSSMQSGCFDSMIYHSYSLAIKTLGECRERVLKRRVTELSK